MLYNSGNPCTCLKCSHVFKARTVERPAVCPKCHTPHWDNQAHWKKMRARREGKNAVKNNGQA